MESITHEIRISALMRISPETEAPGHPTIPLQWLRSSSLLLVCC